MDAIRAYHTGVSEDVLLRQPELKELRKSLLLGAMTFIADSKRTWRLDSATDPRTRLKLAQACEDLATVG